jgi:hypothetical protein
MKIISLKTMIYSSFLSLIFLQITGCFGGNTIADAKIVAPQMLDVEFEGKAYMLTNDDLVDAEKLASTIRRIVSVDQATADPEFEAVLTILNDTPFSDYRDDHLIEKINALRQIFIDAEPQWQEVYKTKIEKLETDLATYQSAYEKDAQILDQYRAMFVNEAKSVDTIQQKINDNLAKMTELSNQAKDYINKVIVDEELPLAKLEDNSYDHNMKNLFDPYRALDQEGTKNFSKMAELSKKRLIGHEVIFDVDGTKYYIPLKCCLYKQIGDNEKHFQHLLKLYVEHGKLAMVTTGSSRGKPQGILLKDLRAAKTVLSNKMLIAGNKYDVSNPNDLAKRVERSKKMVEALEKTLASPDFSKEKGKFTQTLTARAKAELDKPLREFIPQAVNGFYDSITKTTEVSLKDEFGIPENTVAIALHGKAIANNSSTNSFMEAESFLTIPIKDDMLQNGENISIPFMSLRKRSDFQRLSDLPQATEI